MSDHVGDDPTPHAGSGAPRRSATQLATDPVFTGTYAPISLPSGITGTGRFTPPGSAYNLHGGSLRKWRAKRAGRYTGLTRIACIGDSGTAGTAATVSTNDYPTRLRQELATLGYAIGGTGYSKPYKDTRWTRGAGWTTNGQADALFFTCSTNGATLTFASDIAGTTLQFWYGGSSGGFTYAIDGGSAVTVTPTGGGVMTSTTVTGLANTTHTVVFTATSTTQIVFLGAEFRGATGVLVGNFGLGGTTTAGWSVTSAYFKLQKEALAYAPDLSIIGLGVNDWITSVPVATFKTNLAALVTAFRAGGSDVLLWVEWAASPANNATLDWSTYRQACYDVALSVDAPLVDATDRLGDFTTANANGLMDADTIHPNPAGYSEIAHVLAAAVAV